MLFEFFELCLSCYVVGLYEVVESFLTIFFHYMVRLFDGCRFIAIALAIRSGWLTKVSPILHDRSRVAPHLGHVMSTAV